MKTALKSILLTVTFFILYSANVNGANRYFKSGATTWNTAANWSASSSAGVDNAGVPTTADIAIFDSASGSCLINATVSCAGININSGYVGVITQGAFAVTVGVSAYVQAGGSFVSSSNGIIINGAYTLSGGSFNGSTGAISVTGLFTLSAGTFTSTSGNLTLASTNAITAGVFVPSGMIICFPTWSVPSMANALKSMIF